MGFRKRQHQYSMWLKYRDIYRSKDVHINILVSWKFSFSFVLKLIEGLCYQLMFWFLPVAVGSGPSFVLRFSQQ